MNVEHRLAQYRQSESRAVVSCICGKAWSGPTMANVWPRFNAHQVEYAIAACAVVKAELDAEAERMNRILAPSSTEGTEP